MKRLISIITALLLVAQLPLSALAVEFDLSVDSVSVDDTHAQYVSNDESRQEHGGSVTITQSNSETPTSNTVTVTTTNNDVTVTLDNVNVQTQTESPVVVDAAENTTVTVELEGSNTLEVTSNNLGAGAGLEKGTSGNLVIQDEDNDGTLNVKGGINSAAIGGSFDGYDKTKEAATANITITGGTINAESSFDGKVTTGAAIGGAKGGSAENITITGGTVNADADQAAAIGGGYKADADGIKISGGNVTATSDCTEGSTGAAIGGGYQGDAKNIEISNGTVTATVAGSGAAIGSGSQGTASNIVVSGGTVNATSDKGAAIGGGNTGAASNITISGGTVTAESNMGAAIGGGRMSDAAGIEVTGGTVNATSNTGAAIGGGQSGKGNDIAISGGQITATSTDGAAIGGGKGEYYYAKDNIIIDITGGTVSATSTNGAAIGQGKGGSIVNTPTITVSGDAEVTATSTNGSAFGTDKDGNDVVPDVSELNGQVTANQGDDTIIYQPEEPKPDPVPTPDPAPTPAEPEVTPVEEGEEETAPVSYPAAVEEEEPIFDIFKNGETEMEGTEEVKGDVLYVEAKAGHASFTVKLSQLKALAAKGIETVVFITENGAAAYSLDTLLESLEGAEDLTVTIDGETITLHYGDQEKTELLLDKETVDKLVEAR